MRSGESQPGLLEGLDQGPPPEAQEALIGSDPKRFFIPRSGSLGVKPSRGAGLRP